MNVDEAMDYVTKEKGFWSGEVHAVIDTLAAEVERLRAELAAAKAASVLPVKVKDCYSFGQDVEVECHCEDDADCLSGWLNERIKDKTPPEA